jgi:8-amino-7-oxononanoate synthase
VDAHVGTLSKAFGSHGGFVCVSRALKSVLLSTTRTAVFSTALPAPCVAAARASLRVATGVSGAGKPDDPDEAAAAFDEGRVLREKVWHYVKRTNDALRGRALLLGGSLLHDTILSPIFCVAYGCESAALRAAESLLRKGLHAPAIRPPTVPPGTSRVRIALSAAHSDEDIDALIDALTTVGNARL